MDTNRNLLKSDRESKAWHEEEKHGSDQKAELAKWPNDGTISLPMLKKSASMHDHDGTAQLITKKDPFESDDTINSPRITACDTSSETESPKPTTHLADGQYPISPSTPSRGLRHHYDVSLTVDLTRVDRRLSQLSSELSAKKQEALWLHYPRCLTALHSQHELNNQGHESIEKTTSGTEEAQRDENTRITNQISSDSTTASSPQELDVPGLDMCDSEDETSTEATSLRDASLPPPGPDRQAQDAYILAMRQRGIPYSMIKRLGKFTEAESTLRGRVRVLVLPRSQRERRPKWSPRDVKLLHDAMRHCAADSPLPSTHRARSLQHPPWPKIAVYLKQRQSSRAFSPTMCARKWQELQVK